MPPTCWSARVSGTQHPGFHHRHAVYDNEKTLNFSVLANVRPHVETLLLEQDNEAYQKMNPGDVTFRMMLGMRYQNET